MPNIAKHPDARSGHRTKAEMKHDVMVATKAVTPREPDPEWHPIAARMYESFIGSPQEVWFLESDWAMAWMYCESMSRDLKPKFVGFAETWNSEAQTMEKKPVRTVVPMIAASINAYTTGFGHLLATIADRRALKFEVSRPKPGEMGDDGTPVSPSLQLLEGGLTG